MSEIAGGLRTGFGCCYTCAQRRFGCFGLTATVLTDVSVDENKWTRKTTVAKVVYKLESADTCPRLGRDR
jgi:hypothetical protein